MWLIHALIWVIGIISGLTVCWELGGVLRWFPYLAITLVLYLLGLPIIAWAAWRQSYHLRPSQRFNDRMVTAWNAGWMWVWGNEEDGLDGDNQYLVEHPTWSPWRRTFHWSAIQNPQDNLKYVPTLNPLVDPAKITYRGNCHDVDGSAAANPSGTFWTYTKQGGFSGLHLYWKEHIWRIGWKLKPSDAFTSPSPNTVGFALQHRHET